MKIFSRYSIWISFLAVALWIYCLSWAYAPDYWTTLLFDKLHVPLEGVATLFTISIYFVMGASFVGTIFHILIWVIPSLRRNAAPKWYSHLAALAIAWLALGSIITISEGKPPFSVGNEKAQQGS